MARHGIPVTARLHTSHAHGKLTGLKYAGVNKLIDNTLIAILNRTAGNLLCLGDIDLDGGIGCVSGAGAYVELCRIFCVHTLELNFLIVHKGAVIQFPKHVAPKVVTPEQNQDADAYKFGYRNVGISDTYENKAAGIAGTYKNA